MLATLLQNNLEHHVVREGSADCQVRSSETDK